ncbi:ABC transporter ATP-binding protein [uncultured Clostridium sp.]|uniref:ABC transporter ATP-binding protein n=1 Tax=uncultured Clostridium sp. TaxID=59620 RepID=UPI0025FF62DD|nr:ABC transporter ATP-binding protein [uncultured Clostridium sp.]
MRNILKVENLNVSNNGTNILNNISFEVNEGEILGIVGESGSGKSTLLRAITRLMREEEEITSGKVLFKGEDILNISKEEMRKIRGRDIGVIFQNPGSTINPIRKIGKEFISTMKSHFKIKNNVVKEKALDMLNKVNLKHGECIYDSYIFELSGGMKQRSAIALSMVMNPTLLVGDEITSALDSKSEMEVLKQIKNLRDKEGISVILVTHSMKVIEEIADKVCVMYKGEIVEYGRAEEILKNPKDNYTKSLVNATPIYKENSIVGDEVILECKNLKKSYKKKDHLHIAADNINLKLKKGEILGVVGESGSGKSTLSRLIMNLEKLDSGEILFEGKNISNKRGKALRKVYKDIQMVFQDSTGSFNPKMTIGDSIYEYICNLCTVNHNDKDKVIEDILEKVGLDKEYKNRYPYELSGGQCQRAAIARALVTHPKVIILDEATSALDVLVQKRIIELLRKVHKESNLSYIFICHDKELVNRFSDRVVRIENGKLK